MRKAYTPYRKSVRNILRLVYRNELFFALLILFFLGILIGALTVKNTAGQTLVLTLIEGYGQFRQENRLPAIWASSFLGMMIPMLLLFLGGCCLFGQPLVLVTVFLRGVGYGFCAGGLYRLWQNDAARQMLPVLLVNCLMTAFCLLWAGQTALRFSFGMLAAVKEGKSLLLKPFLMRFVLLFILLVPAALLDGAISLLFLR
ncbi:MAG: stage II sporulation protein M [Oscillospiraceae bacterium]|nr:stage II sporulation protein M [Oscillospiraceae bacterium]